MADRSVPRKTRKSRRPGETVEIPTSLVYSVVPGTESMRILFMGSGEIARPTLERLLDSDAHEVVAVVTQPDRPRGRKLLVAACPVKAFAQAQGVPVWTPEKVGEDAVVDAIVALAPDLIVVAAYGQYIKPAILDIPPFEAVNLHPSLLPKYRGAAPIRMAIANGEKTTGVTTLYVASEMDAGDTILQESTAIGPDDTAESLAPRLAEIGARLMVKTVDLMQEGRAPRIPQDHAAATYVHKLTKEDGRIDWSLPAETIRNRVRGFTPWPGCFCPTAPGSKKSLKIRSVRVEAGTGPPGSVLAVGGDGPLLATGEHALRLLEVQPEGKRPMTGAAFLQGHPLQPGDRFE